MDSIIESVIKKTITYIFFCIIITLFCKQVIADVWTQKKNEGILIATVEEKTLKGIDDNGIFDKDKTITQNTLNIYGEYGLSKRMTIGGKILIVDSMMTKNNRILDIATERAVALDTSQIFARIGLIKKKHFALSVSTFIGAPSLYSDSALNSYFSIKKWSYEPKIEIGINFNKYHFLTLTCGYHRNIDHWYDEIRFELTYGYKIEKLLFMLRLQKYVYITTNKEQEQQEILSAQNITIYDFFIQSGFAKLTASIVFPLDKKLKMEIGLFSSLKTKLLFTEDMNVDIYGIYVSLWKKF